MLRGEIWRTELDPSRGSEMRKTRPALIVSVDGIGKLPLRVVVPLTDWNNAYYEYSWMVFIANDLENGLDKIVAADCLNLRSVATERLISKIGDVRPETLEDVLAAISMVLGIP
ncbi:MAG: type II toxin-antitoxin system PemK/MazF family toxin [Armatimonadetes bacterium]|nr:type II toxin-antitoxin system PemK/MazF family toxin [Armatimonadota bacterium]